MGDEPVLLSLDDEVPALPEIMDEAGRLLERRARSETDLADRLASRGYDDSTIASALAALKRLGLVDDAAFALEWVNSRSGGKALGRQALVALLENKGVDRATAEAAVDESGYDEAEAATEVVRANLKRLSGLAPARQAAKLARILAAKGFEEEAALDAIRALLPPDGWD